MALVHDDDGQPPEEPVPPRMPREQALAQHVRRGQQVGGVLAGPGTLRERGVGVDDRGAYVRAESPYQRELVGGQRPGRCEVQRRPALGDGGERGRQVADRLT